MKIVFVMLGLIDLIAAALIFFPISEAIMLYIMVYMIAKGGFFLITGLAGRTIDPLFFTFCLIDVFVGLAIGIISLGFGSVGNVGTIPLFLKAVGMIGILKGLFMVVSSLFG